jgi:hypothetical protein
MITFSKSNFTFSFYLSRKMEMYSTQANETMVLDWVIIYNHINQMITLTVITLSKSNCTFSFYFSRKMEMYSMRADETIV